MATDKTVQWVVKNAKGFNKDNPTEPKSCDLTFPRKLKGITPDAQPASDPAGVIVDADQAIYLIKNFLTEYRLLQKVQDSLERMHGNYWDKISDSLTGPDKVEASRISQAYNTIVKQVVTLSYGVSFDKDILMKVLSQDGCQGVRLYLCARNIESTETPGTTTPHVSLVIVGIDEDGCDLNYNINQQTNKVMRADGDDGTDPTNSMIGEYGYPPDDTSTLSRSSDWAVVQSCIDGVPIDPKYYLLKRACEQLSQAPETTGVTKPE